jgi:GDPmannose 4,6-dehydratase
VAELCGDASKARTKLGWQPRVSFRELVQIMLNDDLRAAGMVPDSAPVPALRRVA